MGLGGLANGFAQGRAQLHAMAGSTVSVLRRAWMVGGQAQGWLLIAQLRFPVSQLTLALPLCQPLALPAAVVSVVRGQCRERRWLSLGRCGIQARKLVDQHVQRPTVGDDVVHRHQQLMVLFIEAHQGHPQQRAFFQIEWSTGFVLTDLLHTDFTLGNRQVADIDELQVEFARCIDLLQRHTVTLKEPSAQGFVTLDQLLETGAQGVFIQLAAQAQGAGNGVGAALRVELPGNPQTVLRQGLRHRFGARQRGDRAVGEATILLLLSDRGGKRA